MINSIPISKFKPNSIKVMGDKLHKHNLEIDTSDIGNSNSNSNNMGPIVNQAGSQQPKSPVTYQEAIRLPNFGTLKDMEKGIKNGNGED